MPVFEWRSVMPASVEELFAYHARPGAFERLAPPWQRLRVVEQSGGMKDGGRISFDVHAGPFKKRWVAEMSGYEEGRQFSDRQVQGPFKAWQHTHRFLPRPDGTSELVDHVEYELPAAWLTDPPGSGPAEKQLVRLFRFRHERTRADLERHALWAGVPRLRVAISGASGLLASSLAVYLTTAGHEVVKLVRHAAAAAAAEVSWDPTAGRLDPADLSGVDAVVNLSGATIASIWTASRRREIVDSRVQATETLAGAMARMESPPKVFVSASAVGAYGSTGGAAITEESDLGEGFLADLCRAWEAAAMKAGDSGVRVVTPRFGIVVSAAGGAVAKMLPAFRAGLGTRLGDGTQWWSWVDLDDLLGALEWALHDDELSGPVNVTSPEPVTNLEFTKTLGRVLHRPAALAAPRPVVSRGLGGMGREMFLASQRAVPMRLKLRGFRFGFPNLEASLRHQLGK